MSNSVDQRVVQMEFDNSNFNKNVQGTLDSLNKLDKGLEMKNGQKGFSKISEAAKNVKFGPIQTALSALGQGFTSLGSAAVNTFTGVVDSIANVGKVATMTVAGLTAAVGGLAVSGGIKRALNLEHANFQLQGLLKSDEKVKQVMDDVNKAVSGTAYGLDEAAVVASQLAASNVQASESGGEMLNVLQAIAGTAAMGGRSFADVGSIFATVAGQGKLMTMQLRQMESMGLNAAATLADYLKTDEAAVREMVTQGEIDFATFSKAMSEAFGEHAQKANETFTGAMSNVKAALSRIGAEFAAPTIENLRKIFVALIPLINQLKTGLKPVIDMFKEFTGGATDDLVKFIKQVTETYRIGEKFGQGISNIAKYFQALAWQANLDEIIGPQLGKLDQWARVFGNFGAGFSAIGHQVGELLKSLAADFGFFFKPLDQADTISSKLIKLSSDFRHFAESLKIDKAHSDAIRSVFTTLLGFGKSVGTILGGAFKGIANILGPALEFLWSKLPEAAKAFTDFADGISNALGPAEAIAQVLENLGTVIGSIFKAMTAGKNPLDFLTSNEFRQIANANGLPIVADVLSTIGGLISTITGAGGAPSAFFEGLSHAIGFISGKETSITGISDAIKKLLEVLSDVGGKVIDKVKSGFQGLGDVFKAFGDGLKSFLGGSTLKDLAGLGVSLSGIWAALNVSNLSKSLSNLATNIGNPFEAIIGGIRNVVVGPFEKTLNRVGTALEWWQNTLKADMILKIAAAIGIIALSLSVLASVDAEGLLNATAAISIIGLVLMGLVTAITGLTTLESSAGGGLGGFVNKLAALKAQFQQILMLGAIGTLILKIAASMMILALAIKLLGSMDPAELAVGLSGLAVAMVLLVGAAAGLAQLDKISKGLGGKLLALAAGIMVISVALKLLSTIPAENLTSVFASLTFTFGLLVGAMAAMGKIGDVKGVGAILAMAAAIAILTPALMALSLLPMQNIAQMMVALGGAMAILVVSAYALADAKMLAGAAALTVLAAAVLLLAPALLILSQIGFEGTAVAIVALGAAFAVLGVAGYLLKPVALTLVEVAAAVALFGAGLLAAGVGVLAFSIALTSLAAGGVASIMILVEGFKMLVEAAISMLPQVSLAVVNALVDIVTGIASRAPDIINAVVTVLMALLEAIATLIPQIVQTGVAIMTALLQGLQQVLPQLISTGITMILMLAQGILTALPALVEIGVNGIISFVNSLANSIRSHHQEMYDAAKNLFLAILEAMGDIFMNIFNDIGGFIQDIPAYISGEKELFADAGTEVGQATTESATESFKDLPQAGETAMDDLKSGMEAKLGEFDGLFDGMGENVLAGFEGVDFASVGSGKMDELTSSFNPDAMNKSGQELGKAEVTGFTTGAKDLPSKAESKTKEAINKAKGQSGSAKSGGSDVGNAFGQGMYNGMGSWIGPIADRAAQMVRDAISKAKAEQKSASPSKVTTQLGSWFGEGYAIGIGKTVSMVGDAAASMVGEATTKVKAFGDFSDLASMLDWDTRPVISPVLDLTDYQSGIAQMNGMTVPNSVIASAGWAGGRLFSDTGANGVMKSNTNSINIFLNYDASADANQLVMDIASGLETRLAMEGV